MRKPAFQKLNIKNNPALRKRVLIGATVTTTFVASLTLTFSSLAATIYNVGIAGEDTQQKIYTFQKDPEQVVHSLGISLDSDDTIGVKPFRQDSENSYLTVYRNGVANVDVDGVERTLLTNGSVADTLAEGGIVLNPGDEVSHDLQSISYDGMEISINRAFDVFVRDGENVYIYRTTGCRVGEAVHEVGLVLAEEDQLSVPANVYLSDEGTVDVLRCTYQNRVVEEKINYGVKVVKDDSLFEGQSKIVSPGVYGKKDVTYRDKFIGDKFVESVELEHTVTEEPVEQVRAVGTKEFSAAGQKPYSYLEPPAGFKLDKNGVPMNYKSCINGVATAYYGGGITSTGVPAAVGYVAVNPKVIPYGTKMWVVSADGSCVYGYAIAADTGGFAKKGRVDLDLYMDTYDHCCTWGIRGVRIYIL